MKLKSFYGDINEDSSANIDITQSGNSSLGLSGNISAVLNDSNIGNVSEVLSLSGIAGLLENESVNERSNRPIKRKDYKEGENSDISLSDDDDTGDLSYCPSDDGGNPFVPHRKKTKSENNAAGKSANVLQSTPKQKGPGRPKG